VTPADQKSGMCLIASLVKYTAKVAHNHLLKFGVDFTACSPAGIVAKRVGLSLAGEYCGPSFLALGQKAKVGRVRNDPIFCCWDMYLGFLLSRRSRRWCRQGFPITHRAFGGCIAGCLPGVIGQKRDKPDSGQSRRDPAELPWHSRPIHVKSGLLGAFPTDEVRCVRQAFHRKHRCRQP
jgi:hypothetical protein